MTTLINTLETPGEFDALSTLRPDEPYFLLIGRDRLAPGLVLQWADARRKLALAEGRAELEHDLRKCTEAEMIAWGMQEYKKGAAALPVVETEPKPGYGGAVIDAETHARDMESRTRTRAVSVINNAIAELVDLIEPLAAISGTDAVLDALGDVIVPALRNAAELAAPARPV